MKRILLINILLTLVLGLGMGIGGWVLGTTHAQENSNVILACVDNLTGTVRIVATQSDCKPSEMGSQWNVQGPQGIQGPQGEPGSTSAPGLSGYEIVTKLVQAEPGTGAVAKYDYIESISCLDGKSVIGGGFRTLVSDNVLEVVGSYPYSNRWYVLGNTTQPSDITIYAICAYVDN